MSNIVGLETQPQRINKEAVELLRNHLARAERGELDGIAIAASLQGGETMTSCSSSGSWHVLNSAVAVLHFRMCHERLTAKE